MKTKSLLLFLVLAGCAPKLDITTAPIEVTQTAAFRSAGITSYNAIEMRSATSSGGSTSEVAGAKCRLQGSGFFADFVTPALVRLPAYGRNSPNTTVSCTLGERTTSKVMNVVNITAKARSNSAASAGGAVGGILGGVVAGAIASAEQPGDVWGYENTTIVFRD